MSKKVDICVHDVEYLICQTSYLWRRLLGIKIKELDLTLIEKRTLFAVKRYVGLPQAQIAQLLELEPQNLIRVLDSLEKKNYIVRKANPEDRRTKALCVTEEGEALIEKIKAISEKIKPQILAGLSPKELEATLKYLAQIRSNILHELGE